jgi:hypothetical protein
MAVPAMVKNPHAGMVKNRPQGGGYLNSYFYKLCFAKIADVQMFS